jgi:hypothetical protein
MKRSIDYYGFKVKYISRKFFNWIKKTHSLFTIIILWIIVLLFILWNNLYQKIYSDNYLINTIRYTSGSINTYNDSSLYSFISLSYICRYYFDLKLFWNDALYENKIKAEYPFIDSISISSFSNNTLVLDIKFIKPSLRFLYKNTSYGVYGKNFIILGPQDSLWYGIPLVLLPIYLNESSQSIAGLLYNINTDKMLYDLLLLKTVPISWSVTYIPWWDKYILRNNDIRIYFNAKKDINHQLFILSTLMSQYRWFDQLRQIDIGSLDNPIIK